MDVFLLQFCLALLRPREVGLLHFGTMNCGHRKGHFGEDPGYGRTGVADRSRAMASGRSPGLSRAFFILDRRPQRRGTDGSLCCLLISSSSKGLCSGVWSGDSHCIGGQKELLCADPCRTWRSSEQASGGEPESSVTGDGCSSAFQ